MSRETIRCKWCLSDPLYIKYHDDEWGVPVYDDKKLFEFLILENFQAGLSWLTILKKREAFRQALDEFNYKVIANYSNEKLKLLANDSSIIRNRLKIKSVKTNAISFLKIQNEFGNFSKYIWQFVDNTPIKNNFDYIAQIPTSNEVSIHISLDLKKRGFKFVGPKIVYAYMQAIGMVNDHLSSCFRYNLI